MIHLFFFLFFVIEITSRFVFLCSFDRDLASPSFIVRTFASDSSEVIQEVICKKTKIFLAFFRALLNQVSKVIWDCIIFSIFRSVSGLEN